MKNSDELILQTAFFAFFGLIQHKFKLKKCPNSTFWIAERLLDGLMLVESEKNTCF